MFIGIEISLTGSCVGSIGNGIPANVFQWEGLEPMQSEDGSYEQAG